jgi:hypothetical protein
MRYFLVHIFFTNVVVLINESSIEVAQKLEL